MHLIPPLRRWRTQVDLCAFEASKFQDSNIERRCGKKKEREKERGRMGKEGMGREEKGRKKKKDNNNGKHF